ncbi:MAG: FAD-dependent oxidoreductase [bacterium]|nr:FAD-dependent oxidoreductase [bacterium]
MFELIIIGGGPAAVAAGVYAARKQIKTLLIAEAFGGQSLVSNDIQNWIGTKNISGLELAQNLEGHVRAQEGIEIIDGDLVVKVQKVGELPAGHFVLETKNGKTFETKTILVASGSRRRRLGIPGEDKYDGKGVVFCSTCDAPIFKGKTVAIVGGGNAGLEAVVDSIPYASKIYLVIRGDVLKGDAVTQAKVKNHPKVTILYNAISTEVIGDKVVTGLKYENSSTHQLSQLTLDGVFVEIGSMPNADFVKGIVDLNAIGEIITDPKTQQSSQPGIWSAGDVSDVLYKQNNISAGDAVKAILNIYGYLHRQGGIGAHQ